MFENNISDPDTPKPKKIEKFWSFIKSLKKDAFGIISLRENGILKTDSKEKANICNRQFQSAFTCEDDSDPPSKGASPFSSSGPEGLNSRVLKECSNEISPILAIIYNETLARGHVSGEWRQANVSPVFKKGEKYDAANYRPVLFTCICCKTLEHI